MHSQALVNAELSFNQKNKDVLSAPQETECVTHTASHTRWKYTSTTL